MIKTTELNQSLALLAGAMAKSTLPILSAVKVSAGDKTVLTANNMELQIQCTINADVKKPFSTCINYAKFSAFCKAAGDVPMELSVKDDKAVIKAKGRTSINTMPSKDFPEMKMNGSVELIDIDAEMFSNALNTVLYACSINDVRCYLNGVYVVLKDGKLAMNASDGYRLAQTSIHVKSTASQMCIVPKQTAISIANIFKSGDIKVGLGVDSLSAYNDSVSVMGKAINGKYPELSKAFNQEYGYICHVDKKQLLEGIRSVLVTADERIRGIMITLDNNVIKLSSSVQGEESEIEIECDYIGESISLAASAAYLQDAIKKADDTVKISIASDLYAILIDGKNSESTHLVMPMRL